jgi:glycosyltransferase involved in cell wall biosynthesis
VDDGSQDATIEVADELAARYPQLTVLRHSAPKGRLAAIATGLGQSSGEVVLLQDAECSVASDEICRLWRAIGTHEVVLGRPSQPMEWRWNRWKTVGPATRGGFLMFHRRVSGPIHPHLAMSSQLRNYLAGQQLLWHEIELRDRTLQPSRQPHSGPAGQQRRGLAGLWSTTARTDSAQAVSSKPGRPNYLERLREFTLGE